jgi:hydroxypyruvate reductase
MAKAVEELLGKRITAGIVVTKYGHALKLKNIRAFEAGRATPYPMERASRAPVLC